MGTWQVTDVATVDKKDDTFPFFSPKEISERKCTKMGWGVRQEIRVVREKAKRWFLKSRLTYLFKILANSLADGNDILAYGGVFCYKTVGCCHDSSASATAAIVWIQGALREKEEEDKVGEGGRERKRNEWKRTEKEEGENEMAVKKGNLLRNDTTSMTDRSWKTERDCQYK